MNKYPLDQTERIERVDPQGMLACTEGFADQWRDAAARAKKFELPKLKRVDNVVICGMGGSAIGGDLLRSYLQFDASVAIEVVRNYRLPGYVGKQTLVIASSYSGNTEESLSAFAEAKKRGAQRFACSTGGQLADICGRQGIACFPLVPGFSPRAALAYGFVPLLQFFDRWGLAKRQGRAISEAAKVLDDCVRRYRSTTKTPRNPAKKLAAKLAGKLPVVYGAQDHCQPVAQRWQAQINENAKSLAHAHVLPEMNHNEILGWDAPESVVPKAHLVLLRDRGDHPQTSRRFSIMAPIVKKKVDGISTVESTGNALLARLFSLTLLGDFVSIYLALLLEHDPTPIPAIDTLKKKLAK